MKYLGIDYGEKRVGISFSDEVGSIAFPREILPNDNQLMSRIEEIVKRENIGQVVVGDTRSFSGIENPVTKEGEKFAERLKKTLSLPVVLSPEAGSSREASRYAPENDQHNDAAAAAFILQRFLDMKKGSVE